MPKQKKTQKQQERHIGAGEFKARCLQLIDEVNHSRIPIVVTKYGKPLAKLVPYAAVEPTSLFGCLKGTIITNGDIVAGTGETWEAESDG